MIYKKPVFLILAVLLFCLSFSLTFLSNYIGYEILPDGWLRKGVGSKAEIFNYWYSAPMVVVLAGLWALAVAGGIASCFMICNIIPICEKMKERALHKRAIKKKIDSEVRRILEEKGECRGF